MNQTELAQFIQQHTAPGMVDTEMAKQAIPSYLSEQDKKYVEVQFLITAVRQKLGFERGPVPEGYSPISPDLYEIKARVAALEAIQLLHASGAIVGAGQIPNYNEQQPFSGNSGVVVWMPATYPFYGLSTAFRSTMSRLASGDVYLSTLDQTHLTSRAKRCLLETTTAFKHGLYLSATLNVGAASESLWMELGRLVDQKTSSSKKLREELKRSYPSIGLIIDEAWHALVSYADAQLKSVFANVAERTIFKDHADRLRERRNYAIHSDDANLDEPFFTYTETGLLLLDSADYFNKLVRLIAAMN